MKKAIKQFFCGLAGHEWTCDAEEGIKPTQHQLDNGAVGFFDYAKMYCKRCKYVSKLSKRHSI